MELVEQDELLTPEERRNYYYKVSTSPEPFTENDGTLVGGLIFVNTKGMCEGQAAKSKAINLTRTPVIEDIIKIFADERRRYSEAYEAHRNLKPNDKQALDYALGYSAAMQFAINKINQILSLIKAASLEHEEAIVKYYEGVIEQARQEERERIKGLLEMRDVGDINPEWAMSNKDYQSLEGIE